MPSILETFEIEVRILGRQWFAITSEFQKRLKKHSIKASHAARELVWQIGAMRKSTTNHPIVLRLFKSRLSDEKTAEEIIRCEKRQTLYIKRVTPLKFSLNETLQSFLSFNVNGTLLLLCRLRSSKHDSMQLQKLSKHAFLSKTEQLQIIWNIFIRAMSWQSNSSSSARRLYPNDDSWRVSPNHSAFS